MIQFVGPFTFWFLFAAALYFTLCGLYSALGQVAWRRLWLALGLACTVAAPLA